MWWWRRAEEGGLGLGFQCFSFLSSMDGPDGILIEEIIEQKRKLEAAWQGMVVPLGITPHIHLGLFLITRAVQKYQANVIFFAKRDLILTKLFSKFVQDQMITEIFSVAAHVVPSGYFETPLKVCKVIVGGGGDITHIILWYYCVLRVVYLQFNRINNHNSVCITNQTALKSI